MSADEFWHGRFRMAEAYREAARIETERRLHQEWRIGVYVREALIDASRFFREWTKGTSYRYPDKPLFGESASEGGDEHGAMEAMERNKRNFMAMMAQANARLGEEPPQE